MRRVFLWVNVMVLPAVILGWALSHLPFASPYLVRIINDLSWAALLLAAWGNILTAAVHKEQGERSSG